MSKIISLLTLLCLAANVLLKYSELIKLDFLISPLVSLNLLEILIIIFVIFLFYRLLPPNLNRLYLHSRSRKFYNNWRKFKNILQSYQDKENPALHKKYNKIREKLLNDFGFFLTIIKKIHGQDEELSLTNLENCFLVNNIKNWYQKVQRKIPEELDCFDCFIVSVEGYYKNL